MKTQAFKNGYQDAKNRKNCIPKQGDIAQYMQGYDEALIDFDIDEELFNCDCGCDANYTDHSMRLGERGMA